MRRRPRRTGSARKRPETAPATPTAACFTLDLAVEASATQPRLLLRIHDDTGPIRLDPEQSGMGRQHIRDRANALGALYQFEPRQGRPRHWLSMPLEQRTPT
ncbi:MAG: hypothetical protein ABI538_13700 [Pseudoxanthomonas sp.]